MIPGYLVLANGARFHGQIPPQQTTCFGEVVFNTGMTGYVETLTDPSYAGQLLTFTYPLIGNYGVGPREYWESSSIKAQGLIVSELTQVHAHHAATQSLIDWLQTEKIPFITDIDTRALTKTLRTAGVVNGAITASPGSLTWPSDTTIDWVKRVSITTPHLYGEEGPLIIAVDCGMKQNIIRNLSRFPWRIKCVPYDYDFTNEPYDGVFISNGPGDPIVCTTTITHLKKALTQSKPIFGICLGAQLMALAAGAKTYKLPYGHRGQNQPCFEISSQRCFLTSQNHGYAIDETSLPADWKVSFRHLNDGTVAGIMHTSRPFFSVQFHPEASPGPMETEWLFQHFYDLVRDTLSHAS